MKHHYINNYNLKHNFFSHYFCSRVDTREVEIIPCSKNLCSIFQLTICRSVKTLRNTWSQLLCM